MKSPCTNYSINFAVYFRFHGRKREKNRKTLFTFQDNSILREKDNQVLEASVSFLISEENFAKNTHVGLLPFLTKTSSFIFFWESKMLGTKNNWFPGKLDFFSVFQMTAKQKSEISKWRFTPPPSKAPPKPSLLFCGKYN